MRDTGGSAAAFCLQGEVEYAVSAAGSEQAFHEARILGIAEIHEFRRTAHEAAVVGSNLDAGEGAGHVLPDRVSVPHAADALHDGNGFGKLLRSGLVEESVHPVPELGILHALAGVEKVGEAARAGGDHRVRTLFGSQGEIAGAEGRGQFRAYRVGGSGAAAVPVFDLFRLDPEDLADGLRGELVVKRRPLGRASGVIC